MQCLTVKFLLNSQKMMSSGGALQQWVLALFPIRTDRLLQNKSELLL